MWWECSECGCRVWRHHRPEDCPDCGIDGDVFIESDSENEWEPGGGSLRDYWFEVGMSSMENPTFDWENSRHHE